MPIIEAEALIKWLQSTLLAYEVSKAPGIDFPWLKNFGFPVSDFVSMVL